MQFLEKAVRKLEVVGDLVSFFWSSRHWWLVPMLSMLALLGALILLAQTSAISSLIYTLF